MGDLDLRFELRESAGEVVVRVVGSLDLRRACQFADWLGGFTGTCTDGFTLHLDLSGVTDLADHAIASIVYYDGELGRGGGCIRIHAAPGWISDRLSRAGLGTSGPHPRIAVAPIPIDSLRSMAATLADVVHGSGQAPDQRTSRQRWDDNGPVKLPGRVPRSPWPPTPKPVLAGRKRPPFHGWNDPDDADAIPPVAG